MNMWFMAVGLLVFLGVLPVAAFAEEKAIASAAGISSSGYFIWSIALATIALAVIAIVGAVMQMFSIRKALDGIARQPEAGGQLQLSMIIGLAFIESLVLYVLFISIILLFANPFIKYFVQ
jgi:F-type H+-transporting ATPase subunit c